MKHKNEIFFFLSNPYNPFLICQKETLITCLPPSVLFFTLLTWVKREHRFEISMKNSKFYTNRKHKWRSFLDSDETFQSFPITDLGIHPARSCCWACSGSNVTAQWPMVSSLASSLGVGLPFLLVRHCLTLSAPDTGEARNRDEPLGFLLKLSSSQFLSVSSRVFFLNSWLGNHFP